MRRFTVDRRDVSGNTAQIRGGEARHLQRVLRLGPGARVVVVDDEGGQYEAVVESCAPARVQVRLERALDAWAESPLNLVVIQALLKDRKMDLLVRQLTELGVRRLIPVATERCVARPAPVRLQARLRRWHEISRQAVKQCRRARPIELQYAPDLAAAVEMAAQCDLRLVCYEQAGEPFGRLAVPAPTGVCLLMGPEGGFDGREIALVQRAAFVSVSLGPRILRAETATVAACTLAQAAWGDVGKIPLTTTGGLP